MEQRAKTTTDHERIRQWAERRGGQPATVGTTAKRGVPGVLRIDFPGYTGKGSLKPISWQEWFSKFDERGLQFLYQDKTAGGQPSRFFKLVNKTSARRGKTTRRSTTARSRGSNSRASSSRSKRSSALPRSRGRGRGVGRTTRGRSRSAQR